MLSTSMYLIWSACDVNQVACRRPEVRRSLVHKQLWGIPGPNGNGNGYDGVAEKMMEHAAPFGVRVRKEVASMMGRVLQVYYLITTHIYGSYISCDVAFPCGVVITHLLLPLHALLLYNGVVVVHNAIYPLSHSCAVVLHVCSIVTQQRLAYHTS